MSDALRALPVHPLTGVRALGVLPSGTVVWPVRGGSEPAPEPPPAPGPPTPAPPAPAAPPAPPAPQDVTQLPDWAQKQITETRAAGQQAAATVRTQQIELAAWRSAARQGAKADALLDSRTFVDTVSGLDPAADDFTSKLDTAVKAAVSSNPLLRTGQAPPRGGAEFPGGPGGEARPASLEDAVAAKIANG